MIGSCKLLPSLEFVNFLSLPHICQFVFTRSDFPIEYSLCFNEDLMMTWNSHMISWTHATHMKLTCNFLTYVYSYLNMQLTCNFLSNVYSYFTLTCNMLTSCSRVYINDNQSFNISMTTHMLTINLSTIDLSTINHSIDPTMMESIIKWPIPTNVSKIRSFVGVV